MHVFVPHLAPKSLVFMRSGVKFSEGAAEDGESVISRNASEMLLVPTVAGGAATVVTAGIIIVGDIGVKGVGFSRSKEPRDKRSPDPNEAGTGGAVCEGVEACGGIGDVVVVVVVVESRSKTDYNDNYRGHRRLNWR